mmetsp:Transcript_8074/g.23144  ORF Transcript_8074/g.23144 Transcript_8074/m.23144 type:complete len:322 (-) Transcript_8074:250-1215(-)|eukprot:CAMPEP_0117669628 /NCGR_PEP_ID=MMETSP0804-20121206/12246_1 /TAXON_ID=1074897 /ORGANISM="Tetraselmis astigmatica, Strain CCMP880" /LENGTH=321 /DNA_ID=CAMNT_0005477723 /DNA_START=51 /DNA_END=1016 /DNA_ORIENTATION=-
MLAAAFRAAFLLWALFASTAAGFSVIGTSKSSTCTVSQAAGTAGECKPSAPSPVTPLAAHRAGNCPDPDPALQSLAGSNHLRACVVCPIVPGVRRSSPPAEALADAPWHKIAFRNFASEPTKVTFLDESGADGNFEWLQPGQRAAFFTTSGSWWRAYSMAGEVLLEHRVGLYPIVKQEDGALVNGGRRLRHVSFPSQVTDKWKRPIVRPNYNATDAAVTVGFINLAGIGVDIVWAAEDRDEELVAQLVNRQVEYQLSYAGHKFEFRDPTGKTLHMEAVEDVTIHDCSKASRSAVVARRPQRQRAGTSSAPTISQMVGSMSL